ncbi:MULTISPECIES: membrane protein [unclassified Corynebacterium]|uniref:YkvI family membrane protein n=1 Tax=unclassified Corynebacterium TaxID=2624378 RepID=UPI000556F7C1|nr:MULTISPECIES: membrane protein [unclassified Corynebacterium]
MIKRAIGISMAFIGIVVGAGFASGQEAMQYFVAFGEWGLWGIALAAALMMVTGVSILQLGSYFQAVEHTAVYNKIASPVTAKILDWSTLITLFSIGFVMFAGGGSNINQQFPSIPVWVGGTVMLILVLLVGLMDVDRVTRVIGTITPFIIFFVVLATGYTILTADVDFASLNTWAIDNVNTSLPNWWLSALNYTGLNVMTAVSMSIVIGGNFLDNRAVGIGGVIGGFLYLILLALLVFALFFEAKDVNGEDMPVLKLITGIHPVLGVLMTFVIYGMVFNTAIGMFYALGKRLTRNNPQRFYPVYAASCIIGFILSFIGFQSLVSNVYPILGYLGLLMIVVMVYNRIKNRGMLADESDRRMRAHDLVARKLDPRQRFTKKNERELRMLAAASNMGTQEFIDHIAEDIHEELEEDDELDYDRSEPAPSVTYVQHTKPEVPSVDSDLDFGKKDED